MVEAAIRPPLLMALALALAGLAGLAGSGTAAAASADRPLVYVVVLDGLDGDEVDRGSAPFISSLLGGSDARATYYPQSRSVIPAETNPNHTAMMTGAFPGRSGIPANAFALYAPTAGEDTCVTTGPLDFGVMPTETSGESATCPRAQMVFEAIRRQGNPDDLVTAGIFGKPKLGRIFAGQRFREGRYDADYLWAPCSSGPEDDAYCEDVPTNPVSGYAVDDATVMDEVIDSINEGVPVDGEARRPDFTFVNLHQIDSAGHATGTGPLYRSTIGMGDDQVERLVGTLRARGEWERTVLILLSDHSMDETPSKITLTDTFADAGIAESEFLAVDNGSVDYIYLADRTAPDRHDLLARMRAAALAEPGVAEALYREPNPADGGAAHTVETTHPDWNSAGERSGDLLVTSAPGYAFSESSSSSNPLPGNHGGPQTRDNFLAVTGGSDVVRQGTASGTSAAANPQNVDIAPTVMGLLGLFAPKASDGSFLRKAFVKRELKQVSRPYPPRVKLTKKRLKLAPKGGRYDLKTRGADSKKLLRNSRKSSVKRARLGGGCVRVLARVRSAADVRSRWAKRRVGCG